MYICFALEYKKNVIVDICKNSEKKTESLQDFKHHHLKFHTPKFQVKKRVSSKSIFLFCFISIDDPDSLHHESRHASDDPNTTNLFISTIPRSV